MRDEEIDALIDETARSMTEGAPRPALRAAIRARVAAPRKGVPYIIRGRNVALAGAAAVLVIVGMTMTERDGPRQPPPVFVAAPPPPAAPPIERGSPPAPLSPERRALARAAVTQGPIPPVTPVEVERVAIEPIVLEIVETPMPLRAERIEIEPLIIR